MDELEVHRVGTFVTISDSIKAVVLAVCIRDTGVTYEVSWWNGLVHSSAWLSAFEVSPIHHEGMMRIGFHAITGGDL